MASQVLFTDQTFNVADAAEGGPVTVATTVVFAEDGTIDGVQLFGPSSPIGTHSGVVFEVTGGDAGADGSDGPGTGTEVKTVAMPSVLAAEWQTFMFDTPLPVLAGKAYRIGHRTSLGHYAARSAFFNAAGLTNGDITAPQTGTAAGGFTIANGTFIPSVTTYPKRTFNGNLYPIGPVYTPAGVPEEHTATGTGTATATARATVLARHTATGTAPAGASARATVSSRKPATGTARATATAGQYTAGGSPGPWLTARARQRRIVTRTQVAR